MRKKSFLSDNAKEQHPTTGCWFLLNISWKPIMASFYLLTNYIASSWFQSILVVNFIYLIGTQLSHSVTLDCRRTSLNLCAYFEKSDIAYFKKIIFCFKQILFFALSQSILSQKNMAYLTVRKNSLESSKFLLSITKFL